MGASCPTRGVGIRRFNRFHRPNGRNGSDWANGSHRRNGSHGAHRRDRSHGHSRNQWSDRGHGGDWIDWSPRLFPRHLEQPHNLRNRRCRLLLRLQLHQPREWQYREYTDWRNPVGAPCPTRVYRFNRFCRRDRGNRGDRANRSHRRDRFHRPHRFNRSHGRRRNQWRDRRHGGNWSDRNPSFFPGDLE